MVGGVLPMWECFAFGSQLHATRAGKVAPWRGGGERSGAVCSAFYVCSGGAGGCRKAGTPNGGNGP